MEIMLFGLIAEKAGSTRIAVEASSMAELRARLEERIEGFGRLSCAIAVDRRLVHDDMTFTGAEEIAVLPPFAGG